MELQVGWMQEEYHTSQWHITKHLIAKQDGWWLICSMTHSLIDQGHAPVVQLRPTPWTQGKKTPNPSGRWLASQAANDLYCLTRWQPNQKSYSGCLVFLSLVSDFSIPIEDNWAAKNVMVLRNTEPTLDCKSSLNLFEFNLLNIKYPLKLTTVF